MALLPTSRVPKLRLVGFAVSDPGVTPVPEKGMVSEAFEALLAIETLPLALPPDCGAKVTLKVALWPGVKVTGRFMPLMLKPAPVTGACVMVTLEPPELVTVSCRGWLLPT